MGRLRLPYSRWNDRAVIWETHLHRRCRRPPHLTLGAGRVGQWTLPRRHISFAAYLKMPVSVLQRRRIEQVYGLTGGVVVPGRSRRGIEGQQTERWAGMRKTRDRAPPEALQPASSPSCERRLLPESQARHEKKLCEWN